MGNEFYTSQGSIGTIELDDDGIVKLCLNESAELSEPDQKAVDYINKRT